jgi:hypothetical protein
MYEMIIICKLFLSNYMLTLLVMFIAKTIQAFP